MSGLMGIDLNGLRDVSVDSVEKGVLRGGDVPSVVIIQPREVGVPIRVIAGAEAAMAIEGRGWHWPESARVDAKHPRLRVPIKAILDAIAQNRRILVADEEMSPINLLTAAVEALSLPRGRQETDTDERLAVIAIPDDGRFLEDARQLLINAAVQADVTPTLLWRPVAALLGLEPQLSPDHVARLADREVGVLSCMEDGVHAARLRIEVGADDNGSYIIPVRKSAGTFIPYRRSVEDLAAEAARVNAPSDDPHAGWQLLWGNGFAFSWLLRLPTKNSVVQTSAGWRMISRNPPANLPEIEFSEVNLQALNGFLDGVDYRIYEGPAVEVYCRGERLAYFLRSEDPATTQSLYITTNEPHLAARGCAIYQQRRASDRHTYFDYLPQLRLAIAQGDEPAFINLVDQEERVEGGQVYSGEPDLGLSVQPGTKALNFYLLREGNAKPRHVHEDLPERITEAVPVRLRIRQQPAQGTARLTLIAARESFDFHPIELRWERMTEEDLTEDEVLERLQKAPAEVPPVQPQPCHSLLWTTPNAYVGGSLVQLLPQLAQRMTAMPVLYDDFPEALGALSVLLTRRSSPAILTRRNVLDWQLYRAVSSEGETPAPNAELNPAVIEQFDACLQGVGKLIDSEHPVPAKVRNAIIRFGGWCFLLCPAAVRRHMLETAKRGSVPDSRIYYRSMGKIFSQKEEFSAFFGLLYSQLSSNNAAFKLQEIEGLFYMLSLRERAPFALSDEQATLFACKLLDRIDERIAAHVRISRLVNISLKTYAGLMRYRLVRPDFMTLDDHVLNEKQTRIFELLLKRARRENNITIEKLTVSVIEWCEKRGSDRTILQWDDGDEEDD